MFLKQLARKQPVTIDYDKNGHVQTIKGRVYHLDLREQMLSLLDEQQNYFTIPLSGIRKVH